MAATGDSDTPPAREPLEPRPATQPMMMAATAPRRWVVPLAAVLALLVVSGVAFIVLNRPTEPAVVAPPPPVTSKGTPRAVAAESAQKPEPSPVPVKADPPGPKADAPAGVAKSDSSRPPRPPPTPKPARVVHTQKDTTRRIDDLTTKAMALPGGQTRRMALKALEDVRADLAAGGSPEEAWNTLDTNVMPMLK
jgi:hypothetical protein